MSDDRSSRLRDRRQKQRERVESEPSETDKPSKPSKPSQTDEPSKTSETSVKSELVGTYMYIPEALKKDVDFRYRELGLEYERETGEELEKNRDYYAALVKTGLENLDAQDLLDDDG